MRETTRRLLNTAHIFYRCMLAYWFIRKSLYWFSSEVYYHMLAPLYRQARSSRERMDVLVFVGKWLLLAHRAVPRRLLRSLSPDAPLHLHGATFYLGVESGEAQILREIFDFKLYEHASGFIPGPGWVVFDVGANAGIFTIQQALRGARVFAFEPNPECVRRLTKSIEVNGLKDSVRLLDVAVGAKPSMGSLKATSNATPTGFVSVVESLGEGDVAVKIVSIDEVALEFGVDHIDLLKIDAEGAEYDVLRGAEHTLALVQRVVLEYHSDDLLARVTALLSDHHFTPTLRIANVLGGNAGMLYAERSVKSPA